MEIGSLQYKQMLPEHPCRISKDMLCFVHKSGVHGPKCFFRITQNPLSCSGMVEFRTHQLLGLLVAWFHNLESQIIQDFWEFWDYQRFQRSFRHSGGPLGENHISRSFFSR